jgi:hypothetical protein
LRLRFPSCPSIGISTKSVSNWRKSSYFDAGSGYVGHELMVPRVNDYRSQEWCDHSRLLVRQT